MAGETHRDSDPRRQDEIDYATEEGGGGYWKEGDFRGDPGVAASAAGDPGTMGDPFLLRAEFLLAIQRDATLVVLKAFEQGMVPPHFDTFKGMAVDEAWQQFVHVGLKEKETTSPLKGQLREICTAIFKGSQEETEKVQAVRAYDVHEGLRELANDLERSQKAADAAGARERLEKAIAGFEKAIGTIASIPDARKKRSEAMHDAAQGLANQGASQRGLWKVGDEHIPDMAQFAKDSWFSQKYELLTKSEFDADFLVWQAGRPPRQQGPAQESPAEGT